MPATRPGPRPAPSRRRLALALATAAALAGVAAAAPSGVQAPTLTGAPPIVIGHRGASGYRPEHTLESYRVAIRQGADFVEPDLVLTRDGVPIARHEPLLGATAVGGVALPRVNELTTTNIFAHPEFAGRLRTRLLDGVAITGFWSDDFTLAEVKTLRARERIPALRPGNTAHDDREPIPTLQEVIALVAEQRAVTGRPIGIYPELKHPTFFAEHARQRTGGARFEDTVLAALHAAYGNRADAPVFVQSFEVAPLRSLRPRTRLRLVQLLGPASTRPYDFVRAGDARTYGDLLTPAGLTAVRGWADAIAPARDLVIPRPNNVLGAATTLVADAHRAGLLVHPYTFRAENAFLSADYRRGADSTAPGDYEAETRRFLALGIDGFFTDQPDRGARLVALGPPPRGGRLRGGLGGTGRVAGMARR